MRHRIIHPWVKNSLSLAACLLVLGMTIPACHGYQFRGDETEEGPVVEPLLKIYHLEHINVQAAIDIASTLFLHDDDTVRASKDEKSNSLIIAALPETHAKLEALLERLDQGKPETKTKFQVYYLKHLDAREAMDTLSRLGMDRLPDVRIATNRGLNGLMIEAPDDAHDQIANWLNVIDRPSEPQADANGSTSKNVEVEFYWLVASSDEPTLKEGATLPIIPDTINEIIERKIATRVGDQTLSLAATSLIAVSVASPNTQPTQVDLAAKASPSAQRQNAVRTATEFVVGRTDATVSDLSYSIDGELQWLPDDRCAMSLKLELLQQDGQKRSATDIQTKITIKPEHPTCLAFAQTGSYSSYLIVVIRDAE